MAYDQDYNNLIVEQLKSIATSQDTDDWALFVDIVVSNIHKLHTQTLERIRKRLGLIRGELLTLIKNKTLHVLLYGSQSVFTSVPQYTVLFIPQGFTAYLTMEIDVRNYKDGKNTES